MNLKNKITEMFHEALATTDSELLVNLTDDTILLESGLDSLGFAILVSLLEDELDFDPFTIMEEPVYPTTFGEFVEIYKSCSTG